MAHTKKWTCRDGTKVRICDMDDRHLLNTIRMLKRIHLDALCEAHSAEGMMHGEMASFYIDYEIRGMESVESDHPLYKDLVAEVLDRGLVIENGHSPLHEQGKAK